MDEDIPSEPLKWAQAQFNTVPEFVWKGKIPSEKEMRKKYGEWVYGDRKILRKKYKNDKNKYEGEKKNYEIRLKRAFLKAMN